MAKRGSGGFQDVQLVQMESVVSICEAGRWIGDVNVMEALRDNRVSRLHPQTGCPHGPDEPFDARMTSVESWDQL